MKKTMQKALSLCMAAIMLVGMTTGAMAADFDISYNNGFSDISKYMIKGATKKLDIEVKWRFDEYSEYTLKNCFEGDTNTKIDIGGMENYSYDLLEKQSDGSYVTVKGGAELQDSVTGYVTDKENQAYWDKFFLTEEFKANYKEHEEYFKSEDYKKRTAEEGAEDFPVINSIEDYKEVVRHASSGELDNVYYLASSDIWKDKGSYFSFTKPGVYLVSATKGWSPQEFPLEEYAAVLFISGAAAPTAKPTASKVLVDGKDTAFDAYEIGGNNYFKLRDVAQVVSGSGKQFEVAFDGAKNAINLTSGKPYTAVGGEMAKGDGKSKTAKTGTSVIYKDGTAVKLTAYEIGGNNYFKLRDLGEAFNFDVSWDGAKNTVVIDTTASYTAD